MRTALLLAALALGCASVGKPPPAAPPPSTAAAPDPPPVDAPRRRGKPAILVAMPDGPAFRRLRAALLKEIKRDFDVVTLLVDRQVTEEAFAARLGRVAPACTVLMDSAAVALYRGYQQSRAAAERAAPVLVMMSANDDGGAPLANASGVDSDIPAVTSLVTLRSVIQRPVTRVGVLHRPGYRRFVERQKTLAATEEITMVPVEVPAAPSAADVRAGLETLRRGGVDALWIMNDRDLLEANGLAAQAWRPEVAALAVPVVVGTPTLVGAGPERFGTLAVVPDLEALGVQAANLIYDIAEDDWRADDHPVELPISTETVVNVGQVRQRFGLRDGAMQRIDRAVE
jgi:putative ABC transport system substrate-binding protein